VVLCPNTSWLLRATIRPFKKNCLHDLVT
jgi:hypothetical protein